MLHDADHAHENETDPYSAAAGSIIPKIGHRPAKKAPTRDEPRRGKLIEAPTKRTGTPPQPAKLARAYLTASDPASVETHLGRTRPWSSCNRVETSSPSAMPTYSNRPPLTGCGQTPDGNHRRRFPCRFPRRQVSIVCFFLKRLHTSLSLAGFAVSAGRAVSLGRNYHPKDRRASTLDEHQASGEGRKGGMEIILGNCFGKTGAAQSDAREHEARTLSGRCGRSLFRQKTGSMAQFTISKELEMSGTLCRPSARFSRTFPTGRKTTGPAGFRRRAQKSRRGWRVVALVTATRGPEPVQKTVGMPERFAQAAWGTTAKAISSAPMPKKALIIAPSL